MRRQFFTAWLSIGLQSFGGGATTFSLIQQTFVRKLAWISESEFLRDNALCQLAPGINQLALAILIGKRVAGNRGAVLALAGLLIPSVTVTVLMTALYVHVKDLAVVHHTVDGVIPATIGIGLVTGALLILSQWSASRAAGARDILFCILLMAACAQTASLTHVPIIAILLTGGLLGASFNWIEHRRRAVKQQP